MNNKIRNYVDTLFSDVPRTKKSIELREEMLSNMNERFNDYLDSGMSENEAYRQVVANMGDIDEMLVEVMPDENFTKEYNDYKKKKARVTATAIVLYILAPSMLILISELDNGSGIDSGIIGLLTMFALAAIATGMLVYINMSAPVAYSDFEKLNQKNINDLNNERRFDVNEKGDIVRGRTYESLMSLYWLIITFIYLSISFLTGYWTVTWLIWILAHIGKKIIEIIYDLFKGVD